MAHLCAVRAISNFRIGIELNFQFSVWQFLFEFDFDSDTQTSFRSFKTVVLICSICFLFNFRGSFYFVVVTVPSNLQRKVNNMPRKQDGMSPDVIFD